MARVHRFTLRAASRVYNGQAYKRGASITLPMGSPLAAALLADGAWDHTVAAAPESRRPSAQATAKAEAAVLAEASPRAGAAYSGMVSRLRASVDELDRLGPEDRAAFAVLVKGNRRHLGPLLERVFADPTPEVEPEAPELPESEPQDELGEDEIPPATEPKDPPAPAVVDPELAAEIQAAATAKAAEVDQAKADALAALQAKLLNPNGATIASLVKLGKLAGLDVPPELAKAKDRAQVVANLAALASAASPSPTAAPAPNPEDLG